MKFSEVALFQAQAKGTGTQPGNLPAPSFRSVDPLGDIDWRCVLGVPADLGARTLTAAHVIAVRNDGSGNNTLAGKTGEELIALSPGVIGSEPIDDSLAGQDITVDVPGGRPSDPEDVLYDFAAIIEFEDAA